MNFYHITEEPLKIYGLAVADRETRRFWKLPPAIIEQFPQYEILGKRSVGGRVRFQTDAKQICVRMTLDHSKEDINIPLSGSAGADIYTGIGKASVYRGYLAPGEHTDREITVEKTFQLDGRMDTVTINLPRNDLLLSMEVGVEDNAGILPAPEYRFTKPIVFYGSSITEGGCTSRMGTAYTSIVSRWLDSDYLNMGFSGKARGELDFAKYLAAIDNMGVFVLDYDHNAPSPEHLQETHEPFFTEIRRANPDLPVVILSRPDTDKDSEDSGRRKQIIEATYQHARAAGDSNVWFLDGGRLFGREGRAECTVDGTHPNALGFMRMAEQVYPLLKEILENENK